MNDKSKPKIPELVNSAKPTAKAGTSGKGGSKSSKAQKIEVNSENKPATRKTGANGKNGNTSNDRFGDYIIKNGAFYQVKAVRAGKDGDGFVEFALCDFTCKIVEEIKHDDGLIDSSYLRIEGRRADKMPLPLVDVPAKSFYSSMGNGPNEHWGTTPFIYPGVAKKDNLRAAIHLYSNLKGDVPRRVIYKYTGWIKIKNDWHYLTGSGAITAAGLINSIEVDLGSSHMSRYRLSAPLTGNELKQAVSDALLMRICPNKPHIGAVLLAAVARAPLGESHPTDFAVFIHGVTGAKKIGNNSATPSVFW
jgi:Putative cell wall binding repeat